MINTTEFDASAAPKDYANTQERQPSSSYAFWSHDSINALKKTCFEEGPQSAGCVQLSIDSRNSASHNAYRTLLRPSSFLKPRDPSL